jgi:hypothetical protein
MHDKKLTMAKQYTYFAGHFDIHGNVPVKKGTHLKTRQI